MTADNDDKVDWLLSVADPLSLRRVLNAFAGPVFALTADAEGVFRLLTGNAVFERETGVSLFDAAGSGLEAVFGEHASGRLSAASRQCLSRLEPVEIEERIALPTGDRWWRISLTPVRDQFDESATRLIGSAMDLQGQKEIEARLEQLSSTDPLTNLANRRLLARRLATIEADPDAHGFALYVIELDNFDRIVRAFGTAAADRWLISTSQRLIEAAPRDATVARLSSDRFGVLTGGGGLLAALHLAEAMTEAVSQPFEAGGAAISGGSSIGLVISDMQDVDVSDALACAAAALEAAKQGGAAIRLYDHALDRDRRAAVQLARELQDAIERDEIQLAFQPIVDMATGRVQAFEALLRWTRPDGDAVSPEKVVSCAEEFGLIRPMTEWILRRAVRTQTRWAAAGAPSVRVAINMPLSILMAIDFIDAVRRILAEEKARATDLTIEITEDTLAEEDIALPQIEELRRLGIRIAIDDFGTGYSSFIRLRSLPVDSVKIDRAFVHACHMDPTDGALVTAIVQMVRQLDLEVVAEGVELNEHQAFLIDTGCALGQGYLYARPMSVEDALSFLSAANRTA